MITRGKIYKEKMSQRQAVLLGSFALEQAAATTANGAAGELNQAALLLFQLAETMPAPRTIEVLKVRRIQQAGQRGSRVRYEIIEAQNGQ